jgi:chemotaxis protein methyltransferase CheR
MTDQDFDYIRTLLRDRSAIVLDDGKQYLVENRLAPLLREQNLESIEALVKALRSASPNGLADRVVEAMVTHESSFFRDVHPFESLRKVIMPELMRLRARERTLNIWCAACSSGQEPYSLAMMFREHLPELRDWKINLLATDISRPVLARAKEGLYNQIEANRGLPASLLIKYFHQHGTTWQIRPDIREMVSFRELNLAHPWPFLQRMDLVMMRNVLIYFDVDTKKTILNRLTRVLKPDGYLLLGSAETTLFLDDSYRRVELLQTGFYQLVG